MGDRLGQNVRNDRGIISRFHQNSDFDMRFASQTPLFWKNSLCRFSLQMIYSCVADRYVRPLLCRISNMNPLFCQKRDVFSESPLSPADTKEKQEFPGNFTNSLVPSRDILVLSSIWRDWTWVSTEKIPGNSWFSLVPSRDKGESRIPWKFWNLLSPLQGHIGAKLYLEGLDMSLHGKKSQGILDSP